MCCLRTTRFGTGIRSVDQSAFVWGMIELLFWQSSSADDVRTTAVTSTGARPLSRIRWNLIIGTRNLAGNPDSPQAVIFLASITDVMMGF